MGKDLAWLIGAVECLLAADRESIFFRWRGQQVAA